MDYEELQALAMEIMSSGDPGCCEAVWAQKETFKGSGVEALLLGGIIGAGFANQPEVGRDFLLAVSIGCQEYDDYLRIIEIGNPLSDDYNPLKMLETTSELTTLESIMVGIYFGGGFVGAVAGLKAIATLSELAGIGYTSAGPRSDYRAPLPDWLTSDACEAV